MGQRFNVRLAAARDAGMIATLSRDLVEAGGDWSWHPERVKQALRCKDTIAPVACVGNATAGFALIRVGFDEAHLHLLAVRPGRRRQGMGRALVEWLEQSVLVAGVGIVRVRVRASRPGVQAFFRSLGYHPWPKASDTHPEGHDAICMAHDLWCPPVTDGVR